MMNQTIKAAEKAVSDGATQTVASATHAAEKLRAGIADTAEATFVAIKSEVDQLSRASRDVATLVSAEVVKRPLTYTLAAAGAGALVGVGLMAMLNRPKNGLH